MKLQPIGKQSGALASITPLALAVPTLLLTASLFASPARAADKVMFLPEALLADTSQFVNKYGPGSCPRTDIAGPGVRFDCTGITGNATGYADDYPVSSLVGCTGDDCSAFRDGDGNDKYRMRFENLHASCAAWVTVNMNTGYGSNNAFYQSPWTWVGPSAAAIVELDLNSADQCWGYCPNGNPSAVLNLNQTTNVGVQIASFDGCASSFSIVISPFAQEKSLSTGNNTTITCPGHSLQGYSPSGTLHYNDLDEGFRGYAVLSGLLPNHDYLLSFEGLAAQVALSSAELASCGVTVDDGGRLTTPGGTWPASGGGEYAGLQVVFVDFELITTDASGDYSASFDFDCNGLISDGDLFETRFIVKDAHSWSINDCTGGWENEALYANNVDFDPPFDDDADGHTTAAELGAGSDPNDPTSIPTQEAVFTGGRSNSQREQLITFATISGRRVTPVAADYTLVVNWGPTVDPDTLVARLNRQDVAALFQPVIPGSAKIVTLPLDFNRRANRLVLKIQGEVTSRSGRLRVRRDRDAVVFRR